MDNAIVVDTDVVSYVIKKDTRAELYRTHLEQRLLVLSFMSVAELYRWAATHDWGQPRRNKLRQYIGNYVVHGFNQEMCEVWAQVMASAEKSGRRIECADGWVAATAVMHSLPLVTHNGRHYEGVEDLTVICEA